MTAPRYQYRSRQIVFSYRGGVCVQNKGIRALITGDFFYREALATCASMAAMHQQVRKVINRVISFKALNDDARHVAISPRTKPLFA